ncbi:predicted protein [Postia placenta Mad-698-R]|nr:predicted protein [Postia placenta Mad-698-R]
MATGHPHVTALPPELFTNVLSLLDAHDLCICKTVSRYFSMTIQSVPALQYIIELELAGMVDEPLCPLLTAEKLARLRSLQHMRRHMKLVRGPSIPYNRMKPFKTSPGLLIQCNDRDGIEFCQFPSTILGNEERRWTIDAASLGVVIQDICVDRSQDLLILVGLPSIPDVSGHHGGLMLILSLSQDGDPHSLAAQSRIVMQNVDSRLMHIEGDLVGNLVGIPESFLYGHIDIRSWKTGEFLWTNESFLIALRDNSTGGQ